MSITFAYVIKNKEPVAQTRQVSHHTFGSLAILAGLGFRPIALRHFLSKVLPFIVLSCSMVVSSKYYTTAIYAGLSRIFHKLFAVEVIGAVTESGMVVVFTSGGEEDNPKMVVILIIAGNCCVGVEDPSPNDVLRRGVAHLHFPVVTKGLSERLEQSEIDYMTSRVLAIKERDGNPMGAEIQKFGGATAFYVKEMPWGNFNTVKGISPEDIDYIDDIIGFFRERNRSFQFEIIPTKANADLLGYLSDKGFYQNGFHTTLYGIPTINLPSFSSGITVREMKEDEFELYGKLHCLGTGLNVEGAMSRLLPLPQLFPNLGDEGYNPHSCKSGYMKLHWQNVNS